MHTESDGSNLHFLDPQISCKRAELNTFIFGCSILLKEAGRSREDDTI